MAIVDTETFERVGKALDIGGDILPEPGIVRGSIAVAKFDAIAPDNHFTAKVGLGRKERKVLERIGIPDPTVIRHRVYTGIGFRRRSKASKVAFDDGRP